MRFIVFLFFLIASFIGNAQDLSFDFEIMLNDQNRISLDGQAVSKNELKKILRDFEGEEPGIHLHSLHAVEQSEIDRIKRVISREFDTYSIVFDIPETKNPKNYRYFISGQVLDTQSKPLRHINVIAKGTRTGLVTDEAGNFTIGIPEGTKSLIVEHEDYKLFELSFAQLSSLKETENLIVTLEKR